MSEDIDREMDYADSEDAREQLAEACLQAARDRQARAVRELGAAAEATAEAFEAVKAALSGGDRKLIWRAISGEPLLVRVASDDRGTLRGDNRDTLECSSCGNDVFEAGDGGTFLESATVPCLTCGAPCSVGADEDTAYLQLHDDEGFVDVGQPTCDCSVEDCAYAPETIAPDGDYHGGKCSWECSRVDRSAVDRWIRGRYGEPEDHSGPPGSGDGEESRPCAACKASTPIAELTLIEGRKAGRLEVCLDCLVDRVTWVPGAEDGA